VTITPKTYRFAAPVTDARIDGLELAVHDWGGLGAPTLLAHPTGFHGRVFAPIAERLTAAGRRVWSFDFRGHGDSSAPDITYSWDGFADDVLAVADHLDVAADPALVAAGHSKGAAALILAALRREGVFPRIWAYEPIMLPADEPLPPDEDFALARTARKRRNEWASTDEAYAAYASKPPLSDMAPDVLRAHVEYGLRDRGDGVFELKCAPEIEARVYAMAPNNGLFARLRDVQADVMVVCGEQSTDIGPRLATRIAERLPHGHLSVMPGLGHFGPQQDPDACAESILAFAGARR